MNPKIIGGLSAAGLLVVVIGIFLAQPDLFSEPTPTAVARIVSTRTPSPSPTDTEEPTPTFTPSITPTITLTPTPMVRTNKIGQKPVGIVIDPTGRLLYVSDQAGMIHVVNVATQRVTNEIRVNNPTLSWLALSPRGDRLYATTLDGFVLAIDTGTFNIVNQAKLEAQLPVYRPIVISPDGNRLYVAESSSKTTGLVSLEARGLGLIARFGDARDPRLVGVNRAGNRFFVPDYADDLVTVYSVGPESQNYPLLVGKVLVKGGPTSVVWSRDEARAYVTHGIEPAIAVVNTRTLQIEKLIPVPTNTLSAALTPDGRRLVVTSNISDHVYVIDTATNTLIETFFVGQGPRGIAISPDSRVGFTANNLDGTISVFNLP